MKGLKCNQGNAVTVGYYTRIVTYLIPTFLAVIVDLALALELNRSRTQAAKEKEVSGAKPDSKASKKRAKAVRSAVTFLVISVFHTAIYLPFCILYVVQQVVRTYTNWSTSIVSLLTACYVLALVLTQTARLVNILVILLASPPKSCCHPTRSKK